MDFHLASSRRGPRFSGLMASVAAALLAGACSSNGSVSSLEGLLPSSQQTADAGSADQGSKLPKSDLDKSVEYWGEQHKKSPQDLKAALAYAKNLKAAGHKEQAFGVLQDTAVLHGDSKELASEMGRLALEFEHIAAAEKMLAMADDPTKPDWRVISARGTVMAKQSKYDEAIPLFERALTVSPNQASVMNNLGMAHIANGNPVKAEEMLRRAVATSNDPKIKQNLALVLGLQGKHDEAKTLRASTGMADADTDYVKRMAKAAPETAAASSVAPVALAPTAPTARGARTATAKATGGSDLLRPASGPSAVASPAGSWSTSVSAAR